jgi:hypothetical protein
MEMSGELHALNALPPEKETRYTAERSLDELVSTRKRREESLAPAGKRIQNFSVTHSWSNHYTD